MERVEYLSDEHLRSCTKYHLIHDRNCGDALIGVCVEGGRGGC